jgi:hypothetical protein
LLLFSQPPNATDWDESNVVAYSSGFGFFDLTMQVVAPNTAPLATLTRPFSLIEQWDLDIVNGPLSDATMDRRMYPFIVYFFSYIQKKYSS